MSGTTTTTRMAAILSADPVPQLYKPHLRGGWDDDDDDDDDRYVTISNNILSRPLCRLGDNLPHPQQADFS
jgi:hypothetical protein